MIFSVYFVVRYENNQGKSSPSKWTLSIQISTEESDFDEAIELSIHISTVMIKQIILQ